MITNNQVEEKAQELLAARIADDSYLGDALCDCYAEVRALLKADSLDDKLSAIDSLKAAIEANIARPDVLNQEAYNFLKEQERSNDNSDNWKE